MIKEAQEVLSGNWRAAAKLISRIESGDQSIVATLKELHAHGRRRPIIGLTGPPGAGKSTLADQLIGRYRQAGQSVAVLAIDPSSPFTGGAILGDRIRMARHSEDSQVFIRSMAARGRLGGLAAAAADALTVIDALGVERIIVETVGVGQNEVDILRHSHTVVIVQTPVGGDAVQAAKAGLLEIGDVYAVNKADMPGADRTVALLREASDLARATAHPDAWRPLVVKTQANDGAGIEELTAAIEAHRQHLIAHPDQHLHRQRYQTRMLLVERTSLALQSRYAQSTGHADSLDYLSDEIIAGRCDPYTAVSRLLASATT